MQKNTCCSYQRSKRLKQLTKMHLIISINIMMNVQYVNRNLMTGGDLANVYIYFINTVYRNRVKIALYAEEEVKLLNLIIQI